MSKPLRAKKLELARGHLDYLDDMITQTEVELYVRMKPYSAFVQKPLCPTDYEELMVPHNHVTHVVLNENNVFAYLESLGYDSSKLVKRNDS